MRPLSLALLGVGLLAPRVVSTTPKPGSIQGVWQTVQVSMTGPSPRVINIPEPRPNLTIVTAKHYSRVEDHAESPRAALADVSKASADELRAAWGPFVGEAGTYEITGDNVITMRPIVSKNPAAMARGTFSAFSFRLVGDTAWITEQRNQNGPIANPLTVKLLRVE